MGEICVTTCFAGCVCGGSPFLIEVCKATAQTAGNLVGDTAPGEFRIGRVLPTGITGVLFLCRQDSHHKPPKNGVVNCFNRCELCGRFRSDAVTVSISSASILKGLRHAQQR